MVILPEAVYEELCAIYTQKTIIDQQNWLFVQKPADEKLVAELKKELDKGEAEAIALALELKADAFSLSISFEKSGRINQTLDAMTKLIQTELQNLERQHDIKILYAVESGSRAWGFASADSDWDVRFIYLHREAWYLSIDDKKDSIEIMLPNDLDLSGWELRKALRLFRKSNPPLMEWLNSPIVYVEEPFTASQMRAAAAEYFNPKSCLYHYLSMASGNFREYLKRDLVRTKKYFYVLRPVLACMWIERTNTMAPTEFHKLLESEVPEGNLKLEIEKLLARKMSGDELGEEPRIELLNDFLEEKIEYYTEYLKQFDVSKKPDTETLNRIFRTSLNEFGRIICPK